MKHPLFHWLPSLAVLAAVALAMGSRVFAPRGLFPEPFGMLALIGIGALAALHRPFTAVAPATLGLGTLVLPIALSRWGSVPAVLVALSAFLLAELFHAGQRRRDPADPTLAPLGTGLERTLFHAGAVLLAGAATLSWLEPGEPMGWRVTFPALAYGAGLAALGGLGHALRRPAVEPVRKRSWKDRLGEMRPEALPLVLDLGGFVAGTLLLDVLILIGPLRAGALAALLALLAAEAARGAFRRAAVELRVADLERLQHAHKRILAEISGMGGIAQQILTECSNVLPVQWFQFELLQADGENRSWSAGPDGVLVEGEPRPEARPPALPGVHRRVSWRVLEKRLVAEGEVLAVVRLWCDPRRLEAGSEELLSSLLPQMASSVHRAQLDREAKIDPLTGVPVRRMLESRMQKAYRLCCEEGWSMGVILCDIDFFKKINDTYGHVAGDEALVAFARTLDTHRREGDLCCRYGGEEFTVLLENTTGEAALQLAERLRQAVEELEFEYEGQQISLTFSAGVAAFPELHIKTASELLLLADEALYEAKEQGRNRCLLHLGRGAYRAPAGRTVRSRSAPEAEDAPRPPRIFG